MRLRIQAANTSVGVERGRIVPPDGTFDVDLRVPDGVLLPGLINAHDHLHRNHYGRLGAPPYRDAYAWGDDIHRRFEAEIAAGRALPRRDALLHGAWKNLLAGVTTVAHHDAWEPDFDRDFPLRVVNVGSAHSLHRGGPLPRANEIRAPWCIHLAEGIDRAAAEEVDELDRIGLLGPDLLAVHVVGADEAGVHRLRAAGAAIIWCPTSNEFLFHRTVPSELLAPGVDVLLGSDSLLTGAGTLLDELRAAAALSMISPDRLRMSVAETAARRLGLSVPSLAPGARADLLVLRAELTDATVADVAAVVAAGTLRVLDPGLSGSLGAARDRGRTVDIAGLKRWVCGELPVTGSLALPIQSLRSAPPGILSAAN
jgi:cytosine/adenosine deaminase-related metal-dependent hydrolase